MCSVMLYVMLHLWLHAQATILILILALTEKHKLIALIVTLSHLGGAQREDICTSLLTKT